MGCTEGAGGGRICKGKCLCSNPFDTWVTGCYAIYFALFNLFLPVFGSTVALPHTF